MATCQEVVTRALRKLGVLGAGNRSPTNDQADDGLAVLQGLYDMWVSQGVFGRLTDYIATENYEAEEGQRIASGGYTITFPTTLDDDINGGTRPPYDLSLVVVTGTGAVRKVYDAQEAAWVSLDGLTWAGTAPLSSRDIDGLACAVAVAYADEFQEEVGAITARRAGIYVGGLSRKPLGVRRETEATFY